MEYNSIQFVIFIYTFIFYKQYNLINGKALIGHNIKSVKEGQYSFVVSIEKIVNPTTKIKNNICTGSLISFSHVLTSEDCLDKIENNSFNIVAGSNILRNSKRYSPCWWISYEQWSEACGDEFVFLKNDIAVIRLLNNIVKGLKIATISTIERYSTPVGVNADIVGWGNLENNIKTNALKKVKVEIITNTECGAAASTILGEVIRVPSKYMCTKAEPYALLGDGDSGGPLLYEGKIIAINRGMLPFDNPECYSKGVNIHSHIEYYTPFINATLIM